MNPKRGWHLIRLLALALLAAVLTVAPVLGAPLLQEEDPPEETTNYFCENSDVEHPVGGRLATVFKAEYEDVIGWFCDDGMGFGQIMLALTTARISDRDPSDLLTEERAEGKGWGEIWQERGLIGQGRHQNGNGETDVEGEAGPPAGHGRPEEKGPPPGLNRGEGNGPPGLLNRPPFAGPSRGRGRP